MLTSYFRWISMRLLFGKYLFAITAKIIPSRTATLFRPPVKAKVKAFSTMAEPGVIPGSDTFLYFGYGSNLLRERLTLKNPSAVFKTIAKLEGYELGFDFNHPDSFWHGAAATITECPNDNCWGCVWTMSTKDVSSLNDQEGVSMGIYKPIEVQVETPEGEKLTCRTYYLLIRDSEDKRPSPQYLGVIIKGAEENSLPEDYLARLKAIEHNGYSGEVTVLKEMEEKRKTDNTS